MTKAPLAAKAPEERRERILRATVEVVRERGFAGARVQDIAEAAGTSQGLVLYHFQSLAGALDAAVTFLEDEFYEDFGRALDAQAGPTERLRLMIALAVGQGPAVGDWRLWLELWVRALHDDGARATREALDRRWRAALRAVIEEGTSTGAFDPVDLDAAVMRLSSLIDGLAVQLALEEPAVTPERLVDLWWGSARAELRMR